MTKTHRGGLPASAALTARSAVKVALACPPGLPKIALPAMAWQGYYVGIHQPDPSAA